VKWLLLLPCWFAFNLLAYLLAPILPLFAVVRYGQIENNNDYAAGWRLPWQLAYFDTLDNPLTGDAGHKARTINNSEYWSMVLWLWRNPAVGFETLVLNATLPPKTLVEAWGDPSVQDAPHGKEGYCFTRIASYWNLVYIKRFGTRCIKLDLGWQLKTFAEGNPLTPSARYAMSVRLPLFKVQNAS